jgi:hypothetical protein
VGAVALVTAMTTVLEGDALACGGCFSPPSEVPTVVTDHRMLLSVAKDQSTLYDQIKYSGEPSAFGWVLPISGTVEIGLSADVVFQSLDQITQTVLQAPPQNCPPPPDSCRSFNAPSAAGAADGAQDAGVAVLKQEVVGPYETVQLQASDPTALQTWLSDNGFSLPDDVKPVVDQYVAESFNFLALKLLPGKGVQDMRPVRVTTQGANVALPLRMVAAGTGPTVGITLWILSEGRYEPQNFPSFHVNDDELAWDWTQNRSNYTELRAQKTAAGGGSIWEIESSIVLYQQTLEQYVERGYYPGSGADPSYAEQLAQEDYLPELDSSGNVVKTAVQVRDEDIATMFHGIPTATSRVTRIRADLAHAALNKDLVVTASADQGFLSNVHQITKELNEPVCPVYSGCDQTGTAPRSEAEAQANGGGESFSCSVLPGQQGPNGSAPTGALAAGFGVMALAIGKAARKRRR